MMEVVKEVTMIKIQEFEEKYMSSGKPLDINAELNELHTRIIMACAFGQDSSDVTLPYLEKG